MLIGKLIFAQLPDIVQIEYYFDNDPGFGNGMQVSISYDSIVDVDFNADLSTIAVGYHKLFIRTKDSDGKWSLDFLQDIYKADTPSGGQLLPDIVALEYYFDTDPGFGNGEQVSLTSDSLVDVNFDADLSLVEVGYHKLFVRTKDENDKWSLIYKQDIYKADTPSGGQLLPDIVDLEYYFDTDPGFGNGEQVSLTSDSLVDVNFDADLSLVEVGYHKLFIRTKDENGKWSLIYMNEVYKGEEQEFSLSGGYQFISSRIIPLFPDMLEVMEDNLNDSLDFVRNTAGLMLRKIGPVWVNSIGDWITTEGYLFRMNGSDFLTIFGEDIDPQTPIALSEGYQMISYLPDFPINALESFTNVLGNLEFVRNTGGYMLRKIGPVWVNSIGDMQPGEGYLVKMNADDELIYPEATDNLIANKTPMPEHFKVIDGNPYDPVWSIYFEQGTFNIGDEIAVYDGEILAGAGIVVSDNIYENAVPVFSNLYQSSNYPVFKVWRKSENVEYFLSDYTFSNPYQDSWVEDEFPANDEEYSLLHFSTTGISDKTVINDISIYPNPSEGIFNISIEGVSGTVQMKVFDVHGNDYRFFEIEGTNNLITEKLDLKELAAGVYFISFSGDDFSQVKKIVIQ